MLRRRSVTLLLTASSIAVVSAPADAAEVIVTKLSVPVTTSVDDPCTGEDVALSGDFEAEFVTSVEEEGDLLVRYAFQAGGVKGVGETTGLRYELVGEGHGTSASHHLQRAVTVSDFAMIARPTAGVQIGRARATARFGFTIGLSGQIEQLSMDSLFIDKIDC
jgi:hypothetical protein